MYWYKVLDIFWKFYVRSIYFLCLRGRLIDGNTYIVATCITVSRFGKVGNITLNTTMTSRNILKLFDVAPRLQWLHKTCIEIGLYDLYTRDGKVSTPFSSLRQLPKEYQNFSSKRWRNVEVSLWAVMTWTWSSQC